MKPSEINGCLFEHDIRTNEMEYTKNQMGHLPIKTACSVDIKSMNIFQATAGVVSYVSDIEVSCTPPILVIARLN